MKILVINPGGTSTKIAVFEDEKELFKTNITHSGEDLKVYPHVFDQFAFRKELILKAVEEAGFDITTFAAVAGRGGLMNPITGGTYAVNDRMVDDLRNAVHGEHPSNLGAVLAREIGETIGRRGWGGKRWRIGCTRYLRGRWCRTRRAATGQGLDACASFP